MNDSQTETVDQLILGHLDGADLPEAAADLVLAALLGPEDLAAALGGAVPARRRARPAENQPAKSIGTYLARIEVTGFRGIGPTATLNLVPGPGLTIVTGRNGSGKSSFAEAAEFAFTGDNKRWSGRSAIWQEGWRNLHTTGDARIRVQLGIEGHRGGATVECRWNDGDGLADGTTFLQLTGQRRQAVADLGWATPLELYRPFLSYAELGGLLGGRPSEMHDSLQRILGLGRLVEIESMLKAARKEQDDRRKRASALLPELRTALSGHPDPRARQAEQALAGKVADLDQLDALTTVDEADDDTNAVPLRQLEVLTLPSRADLSADVDRLRTVLSRIDDLAGTPANEARALARLLRDALRHHDQHPNQPCPICAGRILDQSWAEHAQLELRRLTEQAEHLDDAHLAQREALKALRNRIPAPPPALTAGHTGAEVDVSDLRTAWQQWDELIGSNDARRIVNGALDSFDALAAALRPVQAAARQALERRQRAWQPLADQIRAWVDAERTRRHAIEQLAALKKAISWLHGIGHQIRNERLAPVAAQATEIWNTLRQESSVQLGGIRLAGAGTSRRLDLDVHVDGVPGAALSVMSQGELHALALALFLPRATMPESPFRFLLIDDPVQSMDPARVYGLAQVLAEVAKHRQVIVFTHDDRLPAAARHLQLNARILIVDRLARSQVIVTADRHNNPALRYLKNASVIAKEERMAPKVRVPVVCTLIRDALEAACHELIRARDFRAGRPIADTEAAINKTHGLRPTLALALLSDTGRIDQALDSLHPAAGRVVRAANNGSHGRDTVSLSALVEDARQVVERLARR